MLRFDGIQYSNEKIKSDFSQFIFDLGKNNGKYDSLKSVRCFILIVYDETHPYLEKVLQDREIFGGR